MIGACRDLVRRVVADSPAKKRPEGSDPFRSLEKRSFREGGGSIATVRG